MDAKSGVSQILVILRGEAIRAEFTRIPRTHGVLYVRKPIPRTLDLLYVRDSAYIRPVICAGLVKFRVH